MNTKEITVNGKSETLTIDCTELGTVTLNVKCHEHTTYDRTVIMSYDTLLQLAIQIVENHNKPTTIAELEKSGEI
jgi:hypothetical protein